MSDISVSYNIHYSPDPVGVNIEMSVSGTKVSVNLSGVPPLTVSATPRYSANILSDMVSTIGTPLVNAVTLFLGSFAGNFINGKSFEITSVPNISYSVEGVEVTMAPSGLSISDFEGNLKISGDFAIS